MKTIKINSKINKDIFFIKTKVNFKEIKNFKETREPDFISYGSFIIWDWQIFQEHYILDDNYSNGDDITKITDADTLQTYTVLKRFQGRNGNEGFRVIDYDEISSKYFYTKEGVIRYSNHWGNCSSCFWTLNKKETTSDFKYGFAKWSDFKKMEEREAPPKMLFLPFKIKAVITNIFAKINKIFISTKCNYKIN